LSLGEQSFREGIARGADFQHMRTERLVNTRGRQTAAGEQNQNERGKVLAVVSDKGGAGTTTAAVNIAINMARERDSVCLLDLVVPFGSVAEFLNLAPASSLAEVARAIRCRQLACLHELLVQHASGLHVLAEPLQSQPPAPIRPADTDEMLDGLLQSFDLLVVDAPKQFGDLQLLVLDRAEIILFVTAMEIPALRSARRSFDLFHRMGVDLGKIRVLLNRYVATGGMSLQAVESVLGSRVFWSVPDDYAAVAAAINQGLPLAASDARSQIAKSYDGLPQALLGLLHPGER
jgi:pilus assembly protein CpaE